MNESKVVDSTFDAAFAVDVHGAIVAWNKVAEELLGYRRRDVLGRRCWEVVRGRDVNRNRYCGEHCPLRENAFRGEPIHRVRMSFRKAGGEDVQVSVSCLLLDGGATSRGSLVHLLSPVEPLEPIEGVAPARLPVDRNRVRLSARQREILGLLAEGRGTREMSELLGISVATVRNHIQGILGKLEVHSRLEAATLARRIGLV